jgi:hypothetical protein
VEVDFAVVGVMIMPLNGVACQCNGGRSRAQLNDGIEVLPYPVGIPCPNLRTNNRDR